MTARDPVDFDVLPPGLAAAWGVVASAGRRGPKPAHSVDEVIAAATALADERGLVAVSLPNVASAIGLSTNALYRYVGSKDELLMLLADRAWGDPPALPANDWQTAATAWAHALFDRLLARPWLLDVPTTVPLTPHNAAWLNALIAALQPTGMPAQQLLDCAYLLDSHSRYGAGLRRSAPLPTSLRRENPGRLAAERAVRAFLGGQLRSRRLDALADTIDSTEFLADEAPLEGFEFGLARIIDGIDAHVRRQDGQAS
ncbi:MAG: TetR/AcrR family transcriptional regulator [Leifsonia sp.]|uniref:TetR/AcrR family transcriptional regulator n=1 Tax=Leifsonia sp. TaxID=1870902 RepID=UPI003F7D7EC7